MPRQRHATRMPLSWAVGGACTVAIIALALWSLRTGGDFRIGFLYVPIVAASAWWARQPTAIVCAGLASISLVASDVAAAPELSAIAVAWNEFTRVVTLFATAGVVASLRGTRQRLLRDRDELFRYATTDPLTGLYNRRFLDEQISLLHALAARGRTYAVLAMDVDRLKQLNDRFGHGAGDAALGQLATTLRRSVRGADMVCRTGGDEFVVLMPDASDTEAAVVAARIQAAVQQDARDHRLRVTGVSVGIAAWRDGATAQGLLDQADAELYANKQDRRGRQGDTS